MDDRPTVPCPPLSNREIYRRWERKLADQGHLEIKRLRILELEAENEMLRDELRKGDR